MKVITIKQPWASLIVYGYKNYEFRTWKTKYRGDILIHAGKGVDKEAMKKFEHLNLEYPKGSIIGKAKISDCIYIDQSFKDKLAEENYRVYEGVIKCESDLYAFKLNDITLINPIKITGKLSLWEYNY